MSKRKSNQASSLWLGQGFLIAAAVTAWNTFSLGYTLYIHKYMRRWDWWWILVLLSFLFLLAIFGLVAALASFKRREGSLESPTRSRWLLPVRTGFITFLVGWIPCAFIMVRIQDLEPWCYKGILGAILVDWLPAGVVVSLVTMAVGWFFPVLYAKEEPPQNSGS